MNKPNPVTPAEAEYNHARLLLKAHEHAHPVMYKGKPYFIQQFQRSDDPHSSALKTWVYLRGNPEIIAANEITIEEQAK